MSACAVPTCTNYYRKCKKEGRLVSFFRIPRNAFGRSWMQRTRIEQTSSKTRVCGDHFADSNFFDPMTKKDLKYDAVPTLMLPQYRCVNDNNGTATIR